MPDGTAKLIKAQYATYDNRSIDYKNQNKEEGVRQQYTFVNMYADVTDIINKSSKIYGTYSVFNIPYYEHIGGGEGAGGWQLIIVENCDMSSMVVLVATFCDLKSPDSLDPFLNSSTPEFFSYVQSIL